MIVIMERLRGLFAVWLIVFFSIVFVWAPFWFRVENLWGMNFSEGMMKIWSNFDGPNYLTVARTWYDKSAIATTFSVVQPLEYYPAHWPFYPLIIWLFDFLMSGPNSMLVASTLGVFFFYGVFWKFLRKEGLNQREVVLVSLASLVLPARWIVVRSVGSPEAWFMAFLLLSLMGYSEKKYWTAGIFGALAQLTKSPAILLFASYVFWEIGQVLTHRKVMRANILTIIKVSLIPITALAVFGFYGLRVNDFWAYFHSGDNFHLLWPPFSTFGKSGTWVGDFWLEEFVWMWLIYGVGIARLFKQGKGQLAVFGGLFVGVTFFVAHRDIARYILPVMPLALLGWRKTIQTREFKIVLMVLALPAFLFAWNFMLNNTAPIADWAPYL